jgi:F-type H+-transporting ATPase subunit epsilon
MAALPTELRLEFVTPARAIVHEHVDEVQVPGEEGSFGVLPGHAPLLAALATGAMWYRKGREIKYAFVSGGFVEVLPDRVSILAQVAERAEDIDAERAEAARRRAEEQLAKPHVVDLDAERARIELMRAIARLQVARQARPHS